MSDSKNIDTNKIEKRAALEVEIQKPSQPKSNGQSKVDGKGKSK
jgi:hypothetical protein